MSPSAETGEDLQLEVSKLSLAPGEILIVKYLGAATPSILTTIADQVRPSLPEGVKALVIDRTVSLDRMAERDLVKLLAGSVEDLRRIG